MFRELGYSDQAIKEKLSEAWNALFGDHEETRIYYPVNDSLSYILDTGNLDVRTEGMSYGMILNTLTKG